MDAADGGAPAARQRGSAAAADGGAAAGGANGRSIEQAMEGLARVAELHLQAAFAAEGGRPAVIHTGARCRHGGDLAVGGSAANVRYPRRARAAETDQGALR